MWRISEAAVVTMVCICTMLPLAATTIHHEGGAQGGGGGGNPANDLVAQVNAHRSSAKPKLAPLRNSKGLGCMALQCISRCLSISNTTTATATAAACAADGTLSPPCHPPETDITEVYAANCGVELPTVDVITGRLLGCSNNGDLRLLQNATATATVHGKEHTEVGAGVVDHGFWCLLFSSGGPNSSFRLEAAGRGIHQDHGCFSDPDNLSPCSSNSPDPAHHQTTRLKAMPAALLLLLLLFLLL